MLCQMKAAVVLILVGAIVSIQAFHQYHPVTPIVMMKDRFPSSHIIHDNIYNKQSKLWASSIEQAEADLDSIKTTSTNNNTEEEKFTQSSINTTQKLPFPLVVWRFSRPHTLIGSGIAIPALHALAAPSFSALWSVSTLRSIIISTFPALLINIYITGLNQMTDVEIDRVNKPYLPIVAGELSQKMAGVIVTTCLILGLSFGILVGKTQGLNIALWGSAILGTLYSLPPFRLKRFPFLAATCISSVRGVIINVGFFAHALASAFGGGNAANSLFISSFKDPRSYLCTLYFTLFGVVIALMKDVPDIQGDKQFNIKSFTVQMGPHAIFKAARRMLSFLLYAFGIGGFLKASVSSQNKIPLSLIGAAAIAAGLDVRNKAQGVDPEDSDGVFNYYMYLWKIFYLSYFALPFAR